MFPRACFILMFLFCAVGPAFGGPNAGGTLLVHYSIETPVPPEPAYVDGGATSCADLVTQAPAGAAWIMWHVYAAFPANASPRLASVSFGCEFDQDRVGVLWTATRENATTTFFPDQGSWPYPGSGVTVAFEPTLTGVLSEVYCFAGYGYEDATFGVVAHPDPETGGMFADDAPTPHLDPIATYGHMGFGIPGSEVYTLCDGEHPGVCCRGVDGACVFAYQDDCSQRGDLFLGESGTCQTCANQFGACCTVNLACAVMTFGACQSAGGLFQGLNVWCSPNPCPESPGACCRDAGCELTLQENCLPPDDWFDQQPCLPGRCTSGACCASSGVCYLISQLDCTAGGNTFTDGACDPNPCPQPPGSGACCNREDGACILRVRTDCENLGASFSFGGEGTVCGQSPCEPATGACCLVQDDGSCETITRSECTARGGLWNGVDSSCDPNTCPAQLGACCLQNQTCLVNLIGECAAIAGAKWIFFQPCIPELCVERHACCTVWVDGDCALVTERQCEEHGGLYFPGVNTCDPDRSPCVADTTFQLGACCIEALSGQCQVKTNPQCNLLGGTWLSNTPCTPERCTPAVTGACCYVYPAECHVVSPGQCSDAGGLYVGDGAVCDPTPCAENLGACCLLSGLPADPCIVTTEAECLPPHQWLAGAACLPNTCPCCDPVESSSWGKIKFRYR